MATVATLFSAGKDSTLAALLLEPVYDIVLCSCTFGIDADIAEQQLQSRPNRSRPRPRPNRSRSRPPGSQSVVDIARETADALGLPCEAVALDEEVAREAVDRMVADGYPRNGIQRVHEHALETVAARETLGGRQADAVGDGTRRDDRTPTVDRSFAQSLEDRRDVDYVRPLAGYGRSAVDDLTDRLLAVETGPSERLATGDYETELRALAAAEYGADTVAEVFPDHVQSRAVGRRD